MICQHRNYIEELFVNLTPTKLFNDNRPKDLQFPSKSWKHRSPRKPKCVT